MEASIRIRQDVAREGVRVRRHGLERRCDCWSSEEVGEGRPLGERAALRERRGLLS